MDLGRSRRGLSRQDRPATLTRRPMASPHLQQQHESLAPAHGRRGLFGGLSSSGSNAGSSGLASASLVPPPPAVHVRSSYSFTTGIIIGQASVFLLLFLVVRYVVFEDGKAGMKRRAERARAAGVRQVRIKVACDRSPFERVC